MITIMNNTKLRVCSLFVGCGGLDLGLTGGFKFLGVNYPKTGLEVTWAADNNPDAIATIKANPKYYSQQFIENVHRIDLHDFSEYNSIPTFDILTAGFPCQPFSNAGNRGGINEKHGRGTLFEVCERLIGAIAPNERPLAYVYENVKGILSTKMPSGKTVPEEISERMEHLGYNCAGPFLAKSQEYGVPQQRHRVLIIGLRKDLGGYFDYQSIRKYVKQESLKKLKLRDVLPGIDGLPNSDEIWSFSPQARYMVPMIKRSWKDIPYDALPPRFQRIRDNMTRYRAPNFYRRFSWDEINGTITASAQPENCGIIHPDQNRRFSVREIARIQSFPDDFIAKEGGELLCMLSADCPSKKTTMYCDGNPRSPNCYDVCC